MSKAPLGSITVTAVVFGIPMLHRWVSYYTTKEYKGSETIYGYHLSPYKSLKLNDKKNKSKKKHLQLIYNDQCSHLCLLELGSSIWSRLCWWELEESLGPSLALFALPDAAWIQCHCYRPIKRLNILQNIICTSRSSTCLWTCAATVW